MAVILCKQSDGWAGIEAALEQAQTGDTVQLESGDYQGSSTLYLKSGIIFDGGSARLLHDGKWAAIAAHQVSEIVLRNCAIETRARDLPPANYPDSAAMDEDGPSHWGLIWFEQTQSGIIERVQMLGHASNSKQNGAFIGRSEDITVIDARFENSGHNGLSIASTSCRIENTTAFTNTKNGICIFRHRESPDVPSEAVLEANLCHDNGQMGIRLVSSKGDVRGNTCWGNTGSGILLMRDPKSPDAATEAVVEANLCHENEHVGIGLSSSTGEVRGNTCWGNTLGGIALQRDSKSPDAATEAVVEANLCHENGHGGIVLSSSTGDVRGNTCWGNTTSGILILRDLESPDAATEAVVEANLCHENGQAGIVATVGDKIIFRQEVAQTYCWKNTLPNGWIRNHLGRLVFDRPFEGLAEFAPETEAATAARLDANHSNRIAELGYGALTRRLESRGETHAENQARALYAKGALGSLDVWWNDRGFFDAASAHDAAMIQAGRYLGKVGRIDGPEPHQAEKSGADIVFIAEQGRGVSASYWSIMDRLTSASDGAAGRQGRIGLVDTSQAEVQGLMRTLCLVREALEDADPYGALPEGLPKTLLERIRAWKTRGLKLSVPFAVDHTARSDAAMSGQSVRPLLEAELLPGGRGKFAEAVKLNAVSPLFWSAFAGVTLAIGLGLVGFGHLKAFDGSALDGFGAIWHGLTYTFQNANFFDFVELPGLALTGLGGLWAIFNLFLPQSLAFRPVQDWLRRRRNEKPSFNKYDKKWKNWVRKRLMTAKVNTLIIQNAREWSAEDCDALQALGEACPSDKALIIIIQTESAARTGRGVLQGFAGIDNKDRQADLQRLDDMRLVVETSPPEGVEARLASYFRPTETDLAQLLGFESGAALTQEKIGLRSDQFSKNDILPMMVIGSHIDFAFEFDRPGDNTLRVFAGPLWQQMEPLARFLSDDPEKAISLEASELDDLHKQIERSSLVRHWIHPGSDTMIYHARVAERDNLLRALWPIFEGDTARFTRFISIRKAAGAYHILLRLTRQIIAGVLNDKALHNMTCGLLAYASLIKDAEQWSPLSPERRTSLHKAREAFATALLGARIAKDDAIMVEASQLYVLARRIGLVPTPSIADLIVQDQNETVNEAATNTLKSAFVTRLKDRLTLFRDTDPVLATNLCNLALGPERKLMSDEDLAALDNLVEQNLDRQTRFSNLIAKCETLDQFKAVLHYHLKAGKQLTNTVYSDMIRLTKDNDEREALAIIMEQHRKAGIKVDKHYRRLSYWPQRDLELKKFLPWLKDKGVIELLKMASETPVSAANMILPKILMFSSFEPLQQEVKRRIAISIERPDLELGANG